MCSPRIRDVSYPSRSAERKYFRKQLTPVRTGHIPVAPILRQIAQKIVAASAARRSLPPKRIVASAPT